VSIKPEMDTSDANNPLIAKLSDHSLNT
jgi:hypothetical protein